MTNRQRHHAAFTLIETIISLSIMSVILLGLSGAVMIGSRAVPSTTETGIEDRQVVDAIGQLKSDIRQATKIEHKSTASGKKLKLWMKDTGTAGMPNEVVYSYTTASKLVERIPKNQTSEILFDNVGLLSIRIDTEDTDATVVWMLIYVTDTVKMYYEVHISLPDKPDLT